MRSSQDYYENAAECVQLARHIEHPESKALLLEMAQAWIKMAEHAREQEKKAG